MKNRDKFVELANKRVNKAIKDLKLIGNLSNRTNYKYTEEDVKKILAALESEVKNLRKKFESPTGNDKEIFSL